MFECLQDFTGGAICFYLASYSYMVDITTAETRTRRLSILDSFMPVGFIVGLPFGTFIKNNYGLVSLYSVAAGIIFIAMVYVFFVVKDSRAGFDEAKMQEVHNTKSNVVLRCNKGEKMFDSVHSDSISGVFFFRFLPQPVPDTDGWITNNFQEAAKWRKNLGSLLCPHFLSVQGY